MSTNSSLCPFCNATVSTSELERHANNHFEDEVFTSDLKLAQEIAASTSPSQIVNYQVNDDVSYEIGDVSWYGEMSSNGVHCIDDNIYDLISAQIRSDFYVVEDGLIALLRKCLESESENSTSLLSGDVDHFQSIESEDVGWGCGWRNIQMLSSHLLKQRQEVRKVLFGGCGFVPEIASLQRWLEIAWKRGFDSIGSTHFNHKIYGSTNWIGTTECAALFRSFGLRARIVDFGPKEFESLFLSVPGSRPGAQEINASYRGKRKVAKIYGPMDRFLIRNGRDLPRASSAKQDESSCSSFRSGNDLGFLSNHGHATKKINGHQVLVDWVWNYFSVNRSAGSSNRVVISGKPPLYFQHDGHSRTIVGIQVKHQRNGLQQYNLLILDPAHRTAALERSLKENVGWQKLIKRGVHTLRKPQYQVCYIDPGIAFGEEVERLKTLDSDFFES